MNTITGAPAVPYTFASEEDARAVGRELARTLGGLQLSVYKFENLGEVLTISTGPKLVV